MKTFKKAVIGFHSFVLVLLILSGFNYSSSDEANTFGIKVEAGDTELNVLDHELERTEWYKQVKLPPGLVQTIYPSILQENFFTTYGTCFLRFTISNIYFVILTSLAP